METKIKRIITTHYIFLFVTHLYSLVFFLFILDVICLQKVEENKFPGINIKEFR
jgi:hypothetical protein